jgi:hypothetical protein
MSVSGYEPINHLDGSIPSQKSVRRKIQNRVNRTPRRMRNAEARVSGGNRGHLVAAVDTTSVGMPCTPYPAEPPKNSERLASLLKKLEVDVR